MEEAKEKKKGNCLDFHQFEQKGEKAEPIIEEIHKQLSKLEVQKLNLRK